MARKSSILAPGWWDYTTLDDALLNEAARLSAEDLLDLSREGFRVFFYETLEDFYLAEALEYIHAWKQTTAEQPAGICGPIGPTEQLPLVARLVNELGLDLSHAHFWGMDEWVLDGKEVSEDHPLSFRKADMDLCFNRIRPELRMPDANLHFPEFDTQLVLVIRRTAGFEYPLRFSTALHSLIKFFEHRESGFPETGFPVQSSSLCGCGTVYIHPIHPIFINQTDQTLC